MGDDLLGHPQLQCDLADGSGLIADAREYPAAGGVGKGMQRSIDRFSLAEHYLIQALICTNVNWRLPGIS